MRAVVTVVKAGQPSAPPLNSTPPAGAPRAASVVTETVPDWMNTPPVNVLLAVRLRVPAPVMSSPLPAVPPPLTVPLIVMVEPDAGAKLPPWVPMTTGRATLGKPVPASVPAKVTKNAPTLSTSLPIVTVVPAAPGWRRWRC